MKRMNGVKIHRGGRKRRQISGTKPSESIGSLPMWSDKLFLRREVVPINFGLGQEEHV